MQREQMTGVVLWANEGHSSAVVWCDDHGDLAYFSSGDSLHDGVTLDAGDLIAFEVAQDRDVRRVNNPRPLDRGHAPHLAVDLARVPAQRRRPSPQAVAAEVIPFRQRAYG